MITFIVAISGGLAGSSDGQRQVKIRMPGSFGNALIGSPFGFNPPSSQTPIIVFKPGDLPFPVSPGLQLTIRIIGIILVGSEAARGRYSLDQGSFFLAEVIIKVVNRIFAE